MGQLLISIKQLLNACHIEAARIVAGGIILCSIDKLFQELGWEPLQIRRNKHKLETLDKKKAWSGSKLSL